MLQILRFFLIFVWLNEIGSAAFPTNPSDPPVGCPNFGTCINNQYDLSYPYYQCVVGFCQCNTGTENAAIAETAVAPSTVDPNNQYCSVRTDMCASMPCPTNSVCSGMINNYVCSCYPGLSGTYCNETDTTSGDPCSSSPCQNGGTCTNGGGVVGENYTCACGSGFLGTVCEYGNICPTGSPCQNGGSCEMLFGGAEQYCKCPSGYQGANCEVETLTPNDNNLGCYQYDSNKLKNANCTYVTNAHQPSIEACRSDFQTNLMSDPAETYYCTMGNQCWSCELNPGLSTSTNSNCKKPCWQESDDSSVKYAGANETCGSSSGTQRLLCYKYNDIVDFPICNATTCENGGQCVDLKGNSTQCLCPVGFTGTFCETAASPCKPNPCQHGGICANGTTGFNYNCACLPGYTGDQCQITMHCYSTPCQYGSLCVDYPDYSGYSCECLSLYTGNNCDIPNMCLSAPCLNGGNCSIVHRSFNSTFHCDCPSGYTGGRCQSMIDFCLSYPCAYQGMCRNIRPPQAPFFNCSCQPGTSGQFCEINPDDCIYSYAGGVKYSTCNQTDKVGLCVDGFNSFTCVCGPDFTSSDCSIPMIVYNATVLIFGPDAAVNTDIINLLKDLLNNPTNIKDMVPFILGLETEQEREDKSWDYDDMFAWASFEEKTLVLDRDLYKWNDVTLGNCFTFNHRNNTDAQYSGRMTGNMGAFLALLKINSAEYCPWVDTMAIQVFVHPAEEDIFSASVSTNAQPGGQTDLFPYMTAYTRLGGLYGTCIKAVSEVKQYFYTGAYSTDGCLQSCYQQAVEDACDCMDPRYPMSQTAKACSLTNRTCVDEISESKGDPSTWPDCICPLACEERQYDVTWTRSVYTSTDSECDQPSVDPGNCTKEMADTCRVSIIMSDYKFSLFAETPAESFNNFIGSLGGLLGVLMGVSMISFIEIAFLFVAISVAICSKNK